MSFQELKPETEEAWLELRTKVVTASDMGILLGLNKWKSVSEMVKNKENFEPFSNSYTWLGQELEPVVVSAVNTVLGKEFKLFENGSRSFFVDMDIGLGATPDAGDGIILLECKSTKPGNTLRWGEWPPAYYLSQLYTQMICCDYDLGYLGILGTNLTQKTEVLNLPLTIFRLERTKELDEIFLSTVKDFWAAKNAGKLYRVNRKAAPVTEIKLRSQVRKIYG